MILSKQISKLFSFTVFSRLCFESIWFCFSHSLWHGRVKVKTTEEQKEAKRKEREKKLQLYKAATDLIFGKRAKGELDEECLKVSGDVLAVNPDFYTLWNLRKEIFLNLEKTYSKEDIQQLFVQELKFLEQCLQVNPKSYGVWHHRTWAMTHMPEPDWRKEVKLCGLFLEYDERNFHCWDYRRFVAAKAQLSSEEELEFSTNKIKTNFSNYSSWHYRSTLLPLLYPDPSNVGRPTEEILLQEYELVQNAFFTDPNDQSAWFYHRWLLGRGEKCQSIQALFFNRLQKRLFITLAKPVNLLRRASAIVEINEVQVKGVWLNATNENIYSLIWIYKIDTEASLEGQLEVKITLSQNEEVATLAGSVDSDGPLIVFNPSYQSKTSALFTSDLSAEKAEVLTAELESCQQLQELEEENKWCLLTIILLMRAIDPIKYEAATISYFDIIVKSDPYRKNYFCDLRSKFLIENAIIKQNQEKQRMIDLSSRKLTCLYHLNHLSTFSVVNLSDNHLTSLKGCSCLQAVHTLTADNNIIDDITDVGCIHWLEELSLQNNNITSISQLSPLATCRNLHVINLTGNLVCNTPTFQSDLQNLVQSLKKINGNSL